MLNCYIAICKLYNKDSVLLIYLQPKGKQYPNVILLLVYSWCGEKLHQGQHILQYPQENFPVGVLELEFSWEHIKPSLFIVLIFTCLLICIKWEISSFSSQWVKSINFKTVNLSILKETCKQSILFFISPIKAH